MEKTNDIAGLDEESQNFLTKFIKDHKCKKILEIGMADGMSSIAILKALEGEGTLTSIDPYQSTYWSSNGLKNIKKLNLDKNHTFIEKYDYVALPELLMKKEEYDLIFVDGSHIFDHVILNNFYADLLLKEGGYLINDDMWMDAVKKAYNYLEKNYKNYDVYMKHERFTPILKKKCNKEYLGWDFHVDF